MRSDMLPQIATFLGNCAEPIPLPYLIDEFRVIVRDYGFSAAVLGGWMGIGKHRASRFFFNDWPESWLKIYNEQNFFADDPFVAFSRRALAPFLWSKIEVEQRLSRRAKEIYDAGHAYGWREVLGVPIHGPVGYQAMASIATMEEVSLDAMDIGLIETAVRALHDRCRREIGYGLAPEDVPSLTEREIECIQWVASGKTDWEIAQVLGVSKSTVHFHIENVKKKLDLASRAEAVARLTFYGLI